MEINNYLRFVCFNMKVQHNAMLTNFHKQRAAMHRRRAQELISYLMSLSIPTRNRTIRSLHRTSTFWEEEVPRNGEKKFKEDFRMSCETFNWLVSAMLRLRRDNTILRPAISLDKRVAVAVYALGSSAEYRTIANIFGIGRATVGELVVEFCEEICAVFEKEFINSYPPTQTKIEENVKGFETWGFPQTYGAIDGCHIEVCPPKDVATDYYNYKGWYSVVLLAVVDYRYRFVYLNIGSPGRNNDSYVFEKSNLKKCHANDPLFWQNSKKILNIYVPVFLIGDSAFRFSTHLIKPFPSSCTQEKEVLFNKSLSRARRVVENAFGHLKARFRRIGRGLQVNIDNVPIIIKACCILHNILNKRNDNINEAWLEEAQRVGARREQPEFDSIAGDRDESAASIRNSIMEYLSISNSSS